jgi:excinuclease ABC subunit C
MVCFKNGKPAKKEYRHYHIKTVTGIDDFASMREVITRRYSQLVREQACLPNLIVVDGGKGQLRAAVLALQEVGIYGKVPIISIAKRLEEIYFPHDALPLYLSKKSSALQLLQQLRNEAHRFAIAFHRNTRSKAALHTVYEEIPGIGPKTLAKLVAHFGHLRDIQDHSLEQLTAVVGKAKAQIIFATFEGKKV